MEMKRFAAKVNVLSEIIASGGFSSDAVILLFYIYKYMYIL